MPQKIIKLTMVNADIVIKEQTEHRESVRHLITSSVFIIIQNRTGDQATKNFPGIFTENSYYKPLPMCGGFFYAPIQTIKACPGGEQFL